MKTVLTSSPRKAARYILQGEVVAFPTETVYGLGANIFDEDAVKKIFKAKGRPKDNPLIAHISELSELPLITQTISPFAETFIQHFFPGPLTVVLPKSNYVPHIATGGLDTLGVRMPQNEFAQEFLKATGVPIVAPSANLSGKPSPTTWQTVEEDLHGRISCILKGKQTEVGLESTVVDCTKKFPIVLRTGAITLEQLQSVIPTTRLADARSSGLKKSPGTKYRHYSPEGKVILVVRAKDAIPFRNSAYIGLERHEELSAFRLGKVCTSIEEYARSLFLFFRMCDEKNIKTIHCQIVKETGLGLALMDRMKRAAAG
ncbi:MAG: threonylcarbamoyl-AMP synthase [Ignavibacteriales bacterium]|nr:threonylcarbamoyl-AMP synthase [Ignavibacteriales bacterium]